MPVFSYKALNKQGKTIRGVVDADTPQKARQRLRHDGLFPVEISSAGKGQKKSKSGRKGRFTPFRQNRLARLTDMTRQLATLLSAGLPLVTALGTIQEQIEDQDFGHRLALIREEVTGGESLAGSLSHHPDIFPADYIHLIRAGEMSGALDAVLLRLADNMEKSRSRRAKIASALAYPMFMAVVGSGVVIFLLAFIVPQVTGLFEDVGKALPWQTRILLGVSGFLQNYWWIIIIALVLGIPLLKRYMKKEAGYRRVEAWLFRLPLSGPLTRKLLLAQAFRSLSVLTGGGVTLTSALTVSAAGLGKSSYGAALDEAGKQVGQGRSLASGLEQSGLFPPVARRMVAVGETSGTLIEMLDRIASSYEEETERSLSTLTSMVEPIIILFMGVVVGFIVMAVLLPIFDLTRLVR